MASEDWNAELLECARYGEEAELQTCLENGADPNFADETGNTGLHKGEGCTVLRFAHIQIQFSMRERSLQNCSCSIKSWGKTLPECKRQYSTP